MNRQSEREMSLHIMHFQYLEFLLAHSGRPDLQLFFS